MGSGSARAADRFLRRLLQLSQLRTSEGGAQHSDCRASQRTWGRRSLSDKATTHSEPLLLVEINCFPLLTMTLSLLSGGRLPVSGQGQIKVKVKWIQQCIKHLVTHVAPRTSTQPMKCCFLLTGEWTGTWSRQTMTFKRKSVNENRSHYLFRAARVKFFSDNLQLLVFDECIALLRKTETAFVLLSSNHFETNKAAYLSFHVDSV